MRKKFKFYRSHYRHATCTQYSTIARQKLIILFRWWFAPVLVVAVIAVAAAAPITPTRRTVRRRWFIDDEFRKFINREVKQNLNLDATRALSAATRRITVGRPPVASTVVCVNNNAAALVGKLVVRANEFSIELDWVSIASLPRPDRYSRIIITTNFFYT